MSFVDHPSSTSETSCSNQRLKVTILGSFYESCPELFDRDFMLCRI